MTINVNVQFSGETVEEVQGKMRDWATSVVGTPAVAVAVEESKVIEKPKTKRKKEKVEEVAPEPQAQAVPQQPVPVPQVQQPLVTPQAQAVPVQQPPVAVPQPTPQPFIQPVGVGAVPVSAPTYDADQLGRAAGPLMEAGLGPQLVAWLNQKGAHMLTELNPMYFGEFATYIRSLGAQI